MTDNLLFEIVNALVKNKEVFEHMKKSIAWRMRDAEIVDINEVNEIKEEVMVLQREIFDFKKELSNMIRPIIIEQLPAALNLLFAEEEQ